MSGLVLVIQGHTHPIGNGGGRWPKATTKTAQPTHGYEPTREAAMAAFAKSWCGQALSWSRALPGFGTYAS